MTASNYTLPTSTSLFFVLDADAIVVQPPDVLPVTFPSLRPSIAIAWFWNVCSWCVLTNLTRQKTSIPDRYDRRSKPSSAPQPCTNWPTALRSRLSETGTVLDVIVPIGQRRHRAVHSSYLTDLKVLRCTGRAQWRKLPPGEASYIAHLSPAPTSPLRCVPVWVKLELCLMSSCP